MTPKVQFVGTEAAEQQTEHQRGCRTASVSPVFCLKERLLCTTQVRSQSRQLTDLVALSCIHRPTPPSNTRTNQRLAGIVRAPALFVNTP